MRPKLLDHVALWTTARDDTAALLTGELGLRVIERTERFTLVGAAARLGKLTLFDADGSREPAPLVRVALRAREARPPLELPDGLRVEFVASDEGPELDLDHVALGAADPEAAAAEYERYGLRRTGPARVEVGDTYLELVQDGGAVPERSLLNHIGFLVDSVGDAQASAEERGIAIESVVDAPNTLALFVQGPGGVRLEYIEHKPGFGLV